jgi:hypothetical protein
VASDYRKKVFEDGQASKPGADYKQKSCQKKIKMKVQGPAQAGTIFMP